MLYVALIYLSFLSNFLFSGYSLTQKISMVKPIFAGSSASYDNNTLTISLMHGSKHLLESKRIDKELSKLIFNEFGINVAVKFDGVLEVDSNSSNYIDKKLRLEEKQRRENIVENIEIYESKMKVRPKSKTKADTTIEVRKGKTLFPSIIKDSAQSIYGGLIKGTEIRIEQVMPDSGSVIGWGDIFSKDCRETRDGKRTIYSINITDYTGSITLKIIEEKEKCKSLDTLDKGNTILVKGEISYDKYDREIVLRPRNINSVQKVKVEDKSPEKRVELHLHTNMSSMDGINPAGELIKRAYEWGHKAIAITDHGVAQAFPDAMNQVNSIKKAGGKYISSSEQYLCVYDLMYINQRYNSNLYELNLLYSINGII